MTRYSTSLLPIRFFFPLLLSLLLVHQTIYLWVHPWLWTVIALTYVAAHYSGETIDEKKL